MRWKVLAPIAACLFVSFFTVGCTGEIVVRSAPPQERYEVVTAAPSAEHFWVRGHWQWNGGQWGWNPGHWENRRSTAVYRSGHWRDTGRGWVWAEGGWVER